MFVGLHTFLPPSIIACVMFEQNTIRNFENRKCRYNMNSDRMRLVLSFRMTKEKKILWRPHQLFCFVPSKRKLNEIHGCNCTDFVNSLFLAIIDRNESGSTFAPNNLMSRRAANFSKTFLITKLLKCFRKSKSFQLLY